MASHGPLEDCTFKEIDWQEAAWAELNVGDWLRPEAQDGSWHQGTWSPFCQGPTPGRSSKVVGPRLIDGRGVFLHVY